MKIILLATIAILVLIYNIYKWGWRQAMAAEKARMADWVILHQLVHKAEYGAKLVAMHDKDTNKKKRADRYYKKIRYWHGSTLTLPVSIARLNEFAKAWDEGTEEQREDVDQWQHFLDQSS